MRTKNVGDPVLLKMKNKELLLQLRIAKRKEEYHKKKLAEMKETNQSV